MTIFPYVSLVLSVLQLVVEIRMPKLHGELDHGDVQRTVPSRTVQAVKIGWGIMLLFNIALLVLPVFAICLIVPLGVVQTFKLLMFVQKKLYLQAAFSLLQLGLLVVYAFAMSI